MHRTAALIECVYFSPLLENGYCCLSDVPIGILGFIDELDHVMVLYVLHPKFFWFAVNDLHIMNNRLNVILYERGSTRRWGLSRCRRAHDASV